MQEKMIIFMGTQGSGKGTQAKLLKDYLETHSTIPVFHFDTGKGLRELSHRDGYTPSLVKASMDKGELQPIFIATSMWAQAFIENLREEHHVIIDGSPRSYLEAQILHTAVTFYDYHPKVIYLKVREEEALKRLLSRGRTDDTEESIKRRFEWSRQEVGSLLSMYQNSLYYTVIEINGEQAVSDIHKDILKALKIDNYGDNH